MTTSAEGRQPTAERESAARGHHPLVGQPHSEDEGPVAEAEASAADLRSKQPPLGGIGAPIDRRSPFFIGMAGAAGVAVTYGFVRLVLDAGDVLVLIGLAFFVAVGLEPTVSWLARYGVRRAFGVAAVSVLVFGIFGGFFALITPPLVAQAGKFVQQAPMYLRQLHQRHTFLGGLADRLHLPNRIEELASGHESSLFNGVLQAGGAIFNTLTNTVIVLVLIIYFLAGTHRMRALLYRLVPHSRRPRAILIGDAIYAKVGGYVLGNLLVSLITGAATFLWLFFTGVPYPVLLAIVVAVLDLIPVVGAIIGAAAVSLVALTVSIPVCLATVGFYVAYKLLEDYLLVPKIIGRAVQVPALVTVIALLLGGALFGIIGALVAIPAAAAVQLLLHEVVFPRLDRT